MLFYFFPLGALDRWDVLRTYLTLLPTLGSPSTTDRYVDSDPADEWKWPKDKWILEPDVRADVGWGKEGPKGRQARQAEGKKYPGAGANRAGPFLQSPPHPELLPSILKSYTNAAGILRGMPTVPSLHVRQSDRVPSAGTYDRLPPFGINRFLTLQLQSLRV